MSSGWGGGFGAGADGSITDRSVIVEYFTLSPQNISDKYVVLNVAPPESQRGQTTLNVQGGSSCEYGTSFVITSDDDGKRLSWDGLSLDGLLMAGDTIVVQYARVVLA